jgi:hypothetical protein
MTYYEQLNFVRTQRNSMIKAGILRNDCKQVDIAEGMIEQKYWNAKGIVQLKVFISTCEMFDLHGETMWNFLKQCCDSKDFKKCITNGNFVVAAPLKFIQRGELEAISLLRRMKLHKELTSKNINCTKTKDLIKQMELEFKSYWYAVNQCKALQHNIDVDSDLGRSMKMMIENGMFTSKDECWKRLNPHDACPVAEIRDKTDGVVAGLKLKALRAKQQAEAEENKARIKERNRLAAEEESKRKEEELKKAAESFNQLTSSNAEKAEMRKSINAMKKQSRIEKEYNQKQGETARILALSQTEEFKKFKEGICTLECKDFDLYCRSISEFYKSKVQLVLVDPPWNVLDNEYDHIEPLQMRMIIEHSINLLNDTGSLVIMCTFDHWAIYKSICNEFEMFVDNLPLVVVNDTKKNRARANGRNMSSNCFAVLIAHKDYNKFIWNCKGKQNYLPGGFNKWNNVINSYKSPNKLQNINEETVRFEEKSVDLLKKFIDRYSNVDDLVADFFFGSGSTCDACIGMNRKFIGYDKDPAAFLAAQDRINRIIEKKMNEPEKVATRSTIVNENEEDESEDDSDLSLPFNDFPDHIKQLQKSYPDISEAVLLNMECARMGVIVAKSKALEVISNSTAKGLYSNKVFKKGEVVGEYYGDILTEEERDRKYNAMTSFPSRLFSISNNGNVFYIDGSSFCPATYINDARGTGLKNNCEYVEVSENKISVRSMNNIESGTELLVDYGSDFFRGDTGRWVAGEQLREQSIQRERINISSEETKQGGKEIKSTEEVEEDEMRSESDESSIEETA